MGTVRMDGGRGTRGSGGGLVFTLGEVERSDPVYECELHREHESEHSESVKKMKYVSFVSTQMIISRSYQLILSQ